MATSLFHWTLHPWAIYAVVGLAIAYSTFRKGRRQLISSAFIPLIGEKAANGGHRPGHRHHRDLRDDLRFGGVPGPRRPADRRRPRRDGLPARRRQRGPRPADHRAHRGVRAVGGVRRRQGHPVAVEHQHGARGHPGAVRVRRRPDGDHPRPPAHRRRRLLRRLRADGRAHRGHRRRRDARLAEQLDGLLLGLVDLLDALRRHVPGQDQPGSHDPPVRRRRDPRAQPREPRLVRDLRRHGDHPAAGGPRPGGGGHRDRSCSRCCRPTRGRPSPGCSS